MLKTDLPQAITIKTKNGSFKLWKNGKLEDLPEDELMIRPDDLAVYDQKTAAVMAIKPKPAADFYFSVEDEHEAKQHNQQPAKIQNQQIKQFIEDTADNIMNEAKANPTSQLKSVLISRLREVRSAAETKESLGKLNLGKEKMEQLINLAEKYKLEVEQAIKQGAIPMKPAVGPAGSAGQSFDFKVKTPAESSARPAMTAAAGETKEKRPIATKFREVKYGADDQSGGIIPGHITTGPVDEIRGLTLADFRRFGKNAAQAAEKVLEKISLLEDESLLKKAAGIKAWQSSEAGRLYLAIGAEAMAKGKSVEQVVHDRRARGEKYLTPEEFDAVADLNRQLSY